MCLTVSKESVFNRLLSVLADQKQSCVIHVLFLKARHIFEPRSASQEMSSKILKTFQSVNKRWTQSQQVMWCPGPCKQTGVCNDCKVCKNNMQVMVSINLLDSGMLQRSCLVLFFFQKGPAVIIKVSDFSRFFQIFSRFGSTSPCATYTPK